MKIPVLPVFPVFLAGETGETEGFVAGLVADELEVVLTETEAEPEFTPEELYENAKKEAEKKKKQI